jgi:riboflavin synthase
VFTGLVQELGTVAAVDTTDDGVRLTVSGDVAGELAEGDSVAVNGVCLTATQVDGGQFRADVMSQTLRTTSLEAVATPGARVNLELALRAGDRMGGHHVQGHVDGTGSVAAVQDDGFARRVTIAADPSLLRYVVAKGSIAIDGVSLTVAELDDEAGTFTVSLIPETLERTTLGTADAGRTVNLEVDVLAKYVERLVTHP